MDLTEIRAKIDSVDEQLVKLFAERMALSAEVAKYKAENNVPILNKKREREIISQVTSSVPENMAMYAKILYNTIFDVSRSYQSGLINGKSKTYKAVEKALEETPKCFPKSATVACQGTEGAYSQQACDKLFAFPSVMYMNNFRGVFNAVESGLCKYGILPIENSIHGSVTEVYDLMQEFRFSITRSVSLQINHSLVSKRGVKLTDIKEIMSHEQALGQCEKFLTELGVKVTVCENTALAAKYVAESGRDDIAAIASSSCAELYGLDILARDIQDASANHTRFICISKTPEIYPGANRMSMLLSASHKPGALYDIISKFAALGINLCKIESRPIAGRDFEFMFYFDLEISVYSDEVMQLLCDLDSSSDTFVFLGSYSEV